MAADPHGIEKAFATFRDMLTDGEDRRYFLEHEPRFRHCLYRVCDLVPPGCRVLDIGSHYLHQSALLKLLGYEVWSVDVPVLAGLPFVEHRARDLNIRLTPVESLEQGAFLPNEAGTFDLVLFCEIMEHITFNPAYFWQRVYELMKVGGKLYVSTPNSLRLMTIASAFKRILTLSGLGIDVPSIFGNVTYGHHWKEYSKYEIKQYFRILSPDFHVSVRFYEYRTYPFQMGLKNLFRFLVRLVGTWVPWFNEDLEIIVTLRQRTGFLAKPPEYA